MEMKQYKKINESPCKDVTGREVKVGDVLAYSIRRGSYHAIHFGKVYAIEPWEQEYGRGEYLSLNKGFSIKIIINSESFQYAESKYNLDSKYRKYLNDQIDMGHVPANWSSLYVNFPRKTCIGLKRAIIIDPETLPEVMKKVILEEQWVIDKIRLK